MQQSASLSLLSHLCLVVGSLLFGALLGESWLRLAGSQPEMSITTVLEPDRYPSKVTSLLLGENLFYEGSTGARMYPRRRTEVSGGSTGRSYSIETNSLGLRNGEIGARARPRIMFLGDSITFGLDTPEAETYVRMTEQLLRAAGHDAEIINAGVPGLSLADETIVLEEILDATRPDIVVLNFYLNDFRSTPSRVMPNPPRLLERSWLAQSVYRAAGIATGRMSSYRSTTDPSERELEEWCQELRSREARPGIDYLHDPRQLSYLLQQTCRELGNAWTEPAWKYLRLRLDRLSELLKRRGIQEELVMFPLSLQVYAEYEEDFPQRQFRAWAEEHGHSALDILQLFRRLRRETPGLELYPPGDSCHPLPVGHAAIARALADYLSTRMTGGAAN